MPARPRGLLEPCAATSGTHGSEEGGAGKRRPLSDALHHVRDTTMREDAQRLRAGSSAQVIAAVRNTGIAVLRLCGFAGTAAGRRWAARNPARTIAALGLTC